MRIGAIPENLLERLALATNLVPLPLVDTQIAFTMGRAIMTAARFGVFDALADGSRTTAEIAEACGTHGEATTKLLTALTGIRYLELDGDRYRLPARLRKWLLSTSPSSLHDKLLMQLAFEWRFTEYFEHFLASGEAIDFHQVLEPDEWAIYQRGLQSLARLSAGETAQRTPVPKGARRLLDIGGGHGHFAVALCRRHASLSAVILDLPQAVAEAAQLLEAEGLGTRVRHQAGDILETELEAASFDVVFTSHFSHHFNEADNREIARRVARALRPGGVYVIQDMVRPETAADIRRAAAGALMDLYFATTSNAGTWSPAQMAAWQRDARLVPQTIMWLRTLPGAAQQVGVKPWMGSRGWHR